MQQFLLYPQKTGEIVIDPVQLTVLIQQKSSQNDPFFGDRKVRLEMLFGDPNKPKKFKAEDKTEVVEVKDGN